MEPQSKAELLTEIHTHYDHLRKDIQRVDPLRATERSLEGHAKGTLMSVNDLLAYLIGWGELVLKWHRLKDAGKAVDFPESGYKWNQLGLLAQKFYADYDGLDFVARQQRFDDTVSKLVALIDSKSDDELYHQPWYNDWTMGRMIQFNTSSPYKNARTRLRKWLKTIQEA